MNRQIAAIGLVIGSGLFQFCAHAAAPENDDALIRQKCPGMAQWTDRWVAQMNANHPESYNDALATVSQPALRARLLKMRDEDQIDRNAALLITDPESPGYEAAWRKVQRSDARHLKQVKAIFLKLGFPTVAMVGHTGVSAAWILVQHADSDRAFQSSVLDKLPPLVESGDVQRSDFALLTDRLLVAHRLPQRFGSQFAERDGILRPSPIEKPDELDVRRSSMNLPPMQDYLCQMQVIYKTPMQIEPWPNYGPERGKP